jgi:hypothetical protein
MAPEDEPLDDELPDDPVDDDPLDDGLPVIEDPLLDPPLPPDDEPLVLALPLPDEAPLPDDDEPSPVEPDEELIPPPLAPDLDACPHAAAAITVNAIRPDVNSRRSVICWRISQFVANARPLTSSRRSDDSRDALSLPVELTQQRHQSRSEISGRRADTIRTRTIVRCNVLCPDAIHWFLVRSI